MRLFQLTVVLALLAVSLSARTAEVLTLEAAVAEVMASNPDVRAARARITEARARVPQAAVPPDPEVGVMFEQVPLGTTDVGRAEMTRYQLRQEFPFPSKLYKKGRAAHFDAKSAAESERGRIADVVSDLKQTYYEVYRLDRSLEVNRETQKLFKLLRVSTETQYAGGTATADAPLKAQVELSKLQNEEIGLIQERLTHMSHLKAVLNRPGHDNLVLPRTLNWPRLDPGLDAIQGSARGHRPELASLAAAKDRERARLSVARQGLIPDLAIGLEYDTRPGMSDAWTGQAMINLPIFFWARNRGEMKEAKAAYHAAQAEQESMEIHTGHEIEQAYSAVRAASEQVRTYEGKLLPAAKTTLESARIAYATGSIDFMTLVDAARTYRDLQVGHYQTQARLGQSFAMLERLVGTELESKGGHDDKIR